MADVFLIPPCPTSLLTVCLPACALQELAALGRFTLRDEGRTIAIGKVTKLPKLH